MEVDCSSASNWIIYINKRDKPQRRRHLCPSRPRSAPYSGLELSLPQSALCARKDGSKHYANEAASRPIGGLQAARPSVAAIYRRGFGAWLPTGNCRPDRASLPSRIRPVHCSQSANVHPMSLLSKRIIARAALICRLRSIMVA